MAKDNPTRASSFVLELKDAVTKLQVHPGMGRAGRVPGTRELVLHKNYMAIYRVRGDDVVDVVAVGVLGELHRQRVEEPHRRQGLGLVRARVRHRAGMADLCADRRALGVDGVGEPLQTGDGLRAHPDLAAVGPAALADRAVRDRRHAHTAGGDRPVEVDQVVGDDVVGRAGLERRRLDGPVAQRDGAELGRAEHIWRTVHIGS